MKKLGWYVLRSCLVSYGICLVSIVGLFVVVDLSARLGDFLQSGRHNLAGHIFRYYLFNIPIIFGKVSPLITVLAAIFVMTRMKRSNEIVPITASGVSVQRVLVPVVVFAVFLSFFSLALEEWVYPAASRALRERDLSASRERHQFYNLIHDREKNILFFMIRYVPSEALMENVHISGLDEKLRETVHYYATRGRYQTDAGRKGWLLEDGYVQRFDTQGFRIGDGRPEKFDTFLYQESSLLPFDVERGGHQGGVRSLSALYGLWRRNPQMYHLGVRFHFRAAFPFSNLLLLLVGLPFALRTRSRSFFLGAVLSAGVVASFFVVSYLFLRLGYAGVLPPIFAGWVPVALFGSAGTVLFRMIPT
jgi:LPS export ABC transporter permease LptG